MLHTEMYIMNRVCITRISRTAALVTIVACAPVYARQPNYCIPSSQDGTLAPYIVDCRNKDFQKNYEILATQFDPVILVDDEALAKPDMRRFLDENRINLVCKTGKGEQSIDRFLLQRIKTVKILDVLPTNAGEIAAVYDVSEAVAGGGVAQMEVIGRKLSSYGTKRISIGGTHNRNVANLLTEALAKRDDSTVIIVGHNDGRNLKFADGSDLPVTEVNNMLSNRPGRGVLLSCDTLNRVGESDDGVFSARILEWNDIAHACAAAMDASRTNGELTFSDLLQAMQSGLKETQKKYDEFTRLVAYSCGSGLLVVTATIIPGSNDKHARS
jgi:hypothetical protein